MSEGGKNRRDKAAAARAASQSGEKRRERTIRIFGAVTVLVVVVGIIAIAVVAKSTDTTGTPATVPADAAAALPTGVIASGDPNEYGLPYNPGAEGVPVLAIWEDFQCPSCAALEEKNGAGIVKLADEGKVQLIWRPTTFLDLRVGNDASVRAVAAWGCAADAGIDKGADQGGGCGRCFLGFCSMAVSFPTPLPLRQLLLLRWRNRHRVSRSCWWWFGASIYP